MNWQIVRIILQHELRMLLRYRRTVFLAVVLPLGLTPFDVPINLPLGPTPPAGFP